jgi:diadenosine tetraphosphate (Ap4A) HIT family hydrolase
VLGNAHFYALFDVYPVHPGHLLLIARRHTPDLFALDADEFAALHPLITKAKARLDQAYHPAGYNVGANCGAVAGQTIGHFHLHRIPRYPGDSAPSRGGMRRVQAALVPNPAEPTD